jgi:NitT/TauT family transport system substrate-binding protein
MRSLYNSICRLIPVILACLTFLQPASAQELRKIKVTIPVSAINFYPLYVGVAKGYFAREGLDVEIISTSGDGPDVDALIAGSVEFTVSTPNRLMMSFQQGKRLLGVMNLSNRMWMECWMNKDLATSRGMTMSMPVEKRFQTLKGLSIAGSRPGSFSYLLALDYAKRAGLVPQQDVQLIGVGAPPAMIAAVENKQVAAACTSSPTPETAVARGKAAMLTDNTKGVDPTYDNFLFELLYVRPDFAAKEPETVKKMTRALLSSVNYIKTAPDAEQLPILKKYFSGSPDNILLESLAATRLSMRSDGRITDESVNKAADFLLRTGVITKAPQPKDVTSNAFLP